MSKNSAMTIVQFLEARITEDEKQAEKHYANASARGLGDYPIRILAECAAKRAIIELHGPVKDDGWKSGAEHDYLWCGMCGSIDDSPEPFPCDTLKALAAVYKDHSDYQQEWSA